MASRVTVKAINDELVTIRASARLARGSGYFYLQFGEAVAWLDRTVQVATVSDLSLAEWIGEYRRLKKVNAEIIHSVKMPARQAAAGRKSRGGLRTSP